MSPYRPVHSPPVRPADPGQDTERWTRGPECSDGGGFEADDRFGRAAGSPVDPTATV